MCCLVLMQGFESHWYSSNRVLQVFDGSRSAEPQVLLKQVPQQPGLHLWLVKPPCSRYVLAAGTTSLDWLPRSANSNHPEHRGMVVGPRRTVRSVRSNQACKEEAARGHAWLAHPGNSGAASGRGRAVRLTPCCCCLCRQWVPVRLDAADNLHQALSCCLHEDGSCGPPGSKQRVLLDLQCRGFAVQVRWVPVTALTALHCPPAC